MCTVESAAMATPLGREIVPSAATLQQQIRFCHTKDGVRLAYAIVGKGPPLVKASNWLSHVEFDWRSPVWHPFLEQLARNRTVIRYDERGNGLSDWDVADLSFESWVSDLEAVVDAIGLRRFPLLGISQGGPIAVAYAVRHPERVSHLILHGAYARGLLNRDPTPTQRIEVDTLLNLIRVGWGRENPAFRQVFTSFFIPGGTLEQLQLVQRAAARLHLARERRPAVHRVHHHRRPRTSRRRSPARRWCSMRGRTPACRTRRAGCWPP